MNRREFARTMAAFAAVPALPMPALGGAAAQSAAVTAATERMYYWAEYVARVHNRSSPDILARLLKVDGAAATGIHQKLMANGVVGAPNAAGISRAINPLTLNTARQSAVTAAASSTRPSIKRLKSAMDKVLDDETQDASLTSDTEDQQPDDATPTT